MENKRSEGHEVEPVVVVKVDKFGFLKQERNMPEGLTRSRSAAEHERTYRKGWKLGEGDARTSCTSRKWYMEVGCFTPGNILLDVVGCIKDEDEEKVTISNLKSKNRNPNSKCGNPSSINAF